MCETNMFSILCLCAAPTVERVASGFNITTILPPSIASYEQGSQVSPRNGWKFDPVGYCDVNATSFLDAERAPECDGWARRGPDGGYTLAAFEARYRFGDKGLMEHELIRAVFFPIGKRMEWCGKLHLMSCFFCNINL